MSSVRTCSPIVCAMQGNPHNASHDAIRNLTSKQQMQLLHHRLDMLSSTCINVWQDLEPKNNPNQKVDICSTHLLVIDLVCHNRF